MTEWAASAQCELLGYTLKATQAREKRERKPAVEGHSAWSGIEFQK